MQTTFKTKCIAICFILVFLITATSCGNSSKTKVDKNMIGQTGNNTFITNVKASKNGTTVISMADSDNNYRANVKSFDSYGLDYVIDYNNDRDLKILQLTDTQIIDAAQRRTPGRLSQKEVAMWAASSMDDMLFKPMQEIIDKAKPDLILLTGDLIYGEFDDNGTSMEAFVTFMEKQKILWAPVFGNHDNESLKGIAWQCEQFENATYCLFKQRHEIGGNGNYNIGLAKNGKLGRVIYMLDSNGCSYWPDPDMTSAVGFISTQENWYRDTQVKINEIAGKTIPSMVAYHIPTMEVLYAASEAGYQEGYDDVSFNYEIGYDTAVKNEDSGRKQEMFSAFRSPTFLNYLIECGADGTFFGHCHKISTSILYKDIRWTFGLKTGYYDYHDTITGGSLITLTEDLQNFKVEQLINEEYLEPVIQ